MVNLLEPLMRPNVSIAIKFGHTRILFVRCHGYVRVSVGDTLKCGRVVATGFADAEFSLTELGLFA